VVDLNGADAEQIIATVTKCPTGALRYTSGGAAEPAPAPTAMVPVHDGPLLVRGDLRVLDPETGGVIAEETRVAGLSRSAASRPVPEQQGGGALHLPQTAGSARSMGLVDQ
jgi:hypothetical protein